MVHITPLAGNGTDFEEFPNERRRVIRVSTKMIVNLLLLPLHISSDAGQIPTILLAIDRGWLQFTNALASHGVNVDLICEEDT